MRTKVYRRSHTETGKKGVYTERVGPSTHVQWPRSWRDISAATLSPPRSMGSKPHIGILNPEQQRWEKESTWHLVVKISGDSVCLGDKVVWQRARSHLPRVKHSYCYNTSLGSAFSGLPTAGDATLLCSGPVGGRGGVCQLHPAVTFRVLFVWGGSWWRRSQWLNCVALERVLVFLTLSTQPLPP